MENAGFVILVKTGARKPEIVVVEKADLLRELQARVGGNIEPVTLDSHTVMLVNEEGKLHGLPANGLATKIIKKHTPIDDVIVGDAVIVKRIPDDFAPYDKYHDVSRYILPKFERV